MAAARRLFLAVALVVALGATSSAVGATMRDSWKTFRFGIPLTKPWTLARVGVPTAPQRRAPVIVAVVDSGVDARHPALRGRVLPGIDLLNGGPGTNDPSGHGTETAGVIVGNGRRRVGVAPRAVVLPVRVLDANARGTADVAATGIRWAADHGAQVINVSLGSPDPYEPLHEAVKYAWEHGAVVIAAGGNRPGSLMWPAAYGETVAVGATDRGNRRATFSPVDSQLDLMAPGEDVLTTVRRNGIGLRSGTSLSAPFVSGAAALLFACNPALTNEAVVAHLRRGARDLGTSGVDARYGAGLLDVRHLV